MWQKQGSSKKHDSRKMWQKEGISKKRVIELVKTWHKQEISVRWTEAKFDVRAISKNVMQHGQIYPKTGLSAKNVTQHRQIYPKTGLSAKMWRSTDRYIPKLGRQQKCDAARTDIPKNWDVSKMWHSKDRYSPKQSSQQKRDAARTDISPYRAVVTLYPKIGPSAKT